MARHPEDAHKADPLSSGGGGLHRDSSMPVNSAVPVSKIVADSSHSPKLLDRVLLDRVRALIRAKHYSIRTERIYVYWIKRFICFYGKRHPQEMGKAEVEGFLSHLACAQRVAASTQNQALAALLFLYKEILATRLPWLDDIVRAKRPKKLPVFLSKDEVGRLLQECDGTVGLILRLLYGTGMRIMECATLRVMDIDFGAREVIVRHGKGAKDRVTMLPEGVIEALRVHLGRVQAVHDDELAAGRGDVELPFALERKYPRAAYQWRWQ